MEMGGGIPGRPVNGRKYDVLGGIANLITPTWTILRLLMYVEV